MVTYGILSDSTDFLWLLNNIQCTFAIASLISFNGYLHFVKYTFNSLKRLFNVVSSDTTILSRLAILKGILFRVCFG